MKHIRCEVSRAELDRALALSGVMIVGEGANMRITRMPESIWQQKEADLRAAEEDAELAEAEAVLARLMSEEPVPQPKQTLEQELIKAEAELARLESKVFALEGDIAWLVDAMRRIGDKLRGGV